jgi:hypothetical protein
MRKHQVTVRFGGDREFAYAFEADPAALDSAAARAWFDREFVALEADVPSPIGKVLNADRVLAVARYAGAQRFRDDAAWAQSYAHHAAALLGRDFVRVDVANETLGF